MTESDTPVGGDQAGAGGAGDQPAGATEAPRALPDIDFSTFVLSLATAALVAFVRYDYVELATRPGEPPPPVGKASPEYMAFVLPAARARVNRDAEAIRRWVHADWPRVKKTPLAGERRSSSSTKPDS